MTSNLRVRTVSAKTLGKITIYIYSGVGRCQKGGWGGGGGHVMYVPSVKNRYKRVVFGYMVI